MICDTYQIFASRHSCTLCKRHSFLAYAFRACARTARKMHVQLSFVEYSIVVPKVTPSILMWVQHVIPRRVAGAIHFPMKSALDFFGLRRAPVAFSYSCMALCMVSKSVGRVTNTLTLSACATSAVGRARCPILIPGSLSSNMQRRGWRHNA